MDKTFDGSIVSPGELYRDRGHGGQVVRAISQPKKTGYTNVEYLCPNGILGRYYAVTEYLEDTDQLEDFIFNMLFSDGIDGLINQYDLKLKDLYWYAVGGIELGTPVWIFTEGAFGYLISYNGMNMGPIDYDCGKVMIQFIDQFGNIRTSEHIGVHTTPIENKSWIESMRRGLENFGYVFDRNYMTIRKFGDEICPGSGNWKEWREGDEIIHIPSGRNGVIKEIYFDSAVVKFDDDPDNEVVSLRSISYIRRR